MESNNTIRLLILNDSQQEAERLISMLHNAGRPNRAQHVDSEERLHKLLQEQTWDLLIGHDATTSITPENALRQIRRLNRDVPAILLTDDDTGLTVVEGLKLGAVDVVRLDEDQHLLLVIQREMDNREHRQMRRLADRRFREAERRSQALLDSSRDAIAYVQDGLYLYANESFAELFGYSDRDDIDCLPIMDMVADESQDSLKQFLKEFTLKGDEAEATKVAFDGLKQDGEPTPINLEVSRATYDEEPCVQFLARAGVAETSAEIEAQIAEVKWQDLATGLYNRQYLMNQLETLLAAEGPPAQGSLIHIDFDNYNEQVQTAFGVADADLALSDLAALLREHSHEGELLARFGDTAFALLIADIKPDAALQRAETVRRAVEDHIIDIDGKTAHLTASIGVALINDTSSTPNAIIEQAVGAAEQVRNDQSGNAVHLYEPAMSADERRERDIKAEVQHALDNDRFRLLFQPIINLRGSDNEYYEVLLRLLNQEDQEVSPKEFLSTAARMKVSHKIDRWVILESIKMLAEHRSKGNPDTRLVINLSPQSLCDESLPPWLGVAFKAAKLPSDALVFQASEMDITNHLNAAKAFAQGLQKLNSGGLSITGFGCSLNPFNVFKHVPLSFVKVDGSFTQDIQNNNEKPDALVELIQQLHEENVTTIVPFVENAGVLATLWQAGVHYIQGYYLQEPSHSMDYDFNMEQ